LLIEEIKQEKLNGHTIQKQKSVYDSNSYMMGNSDDEKSRQPIRKGANHS
jgi:hypothetical protein